MGNTVDSILKAKGGEIWSLPPDATVYDAVAMMADKGIGALMVIERGELVGIVSERDYARKIVLQGRSSKETRVRDVMTNSPVTVTPDYTVEECMEMMTNHRIRHLPVLEDNALVGVVSIGDLVKAIISAQAETIEHLNRYITGA